MRTSPLLNWARLLRAPNLLTAPGDALGGLFLLATAAARPVHAPALLLVSLASVAAYAFGILTNDLFDLEEDRRCRPERPLPSGAIGTRAALLAAVALALASLALAWLIAPPALLADAALLACILLYNGLAKRRRLPGALVMGLCRGLNVLLGAACVLPAGATAAALSPALPPAIGVTAIIAAVTWLADGETRVQTPGRLVFLPAAATLVAWLAAAPALPYPAIFAYGAFSLSFLLAALAAGQFFTLALAIYDHETTPATLPPVIGAHIRTLIPWQLSWILLGNSLHAAVAAVALLLAWWLARRLARHLPQS